MILQGIEITELESLNDIVEFCERLEVMEDLYTSQHKSAGDSECNVKDSQKGGKREALANKWSAQGPEGPHPKQQFSRSKNRKKWCNLHQSVTHNMGECKILLEQARKMRASYRGATKEKKCSFEGYSKKEKVSKVHEMVHLLVQQELAKMSKD